MNRIARNYIRMHRKRAGLSQRELGRLLGSRDQWTISRHETSTTIPSLVIALSYERIFRVPVSELFAGLYTIAFRVVEENLNQFETQLQRDPAKGSAARLASQKIRWLAERKTRG